jgi:hypothetical protein
VGLGRKHRPRVYPAVYEDSKFSGTETSFAATIRRIPTTLFETATFSHFPILKLDVSLRSDTRNIDAQRGGECTLLCNLKADYAQPPPLDRITGLDSVILFDTTMVGRKLHLAIEAAKAVVEATCSNDRLGIVTFGHQTSTVSDLILCTPSYKAAVQKLLLSTSSYAEGSVDITEGVRSAVGLLAKDARHGGHIFTITAGRFLCIDRPSRHNTTIHCISIGALTDVSSIRNLLRQQGVILNFSSKHDAKDVINFINHLASHPPSPPIETLRVRLSSSVNVQITSIQTDVETLPPTETSITLRTPNSFLTNPEHLPIFITRTILITLLVHPVPGLSRPASPTD